MKDQISGITFGVRFNRSFRIPEISGEMVDEILYGTDSPFSAEFFPKIDRNSSEKTLYSPNADGNAERYLRINTDDIILAWKVNDGYEEAFRWLKDDVVKYYKDKLFLKFGIKNIQRAGIVYTHTIPDTSKLQKTVNDLTSTKVSDATGINLSFAKKGPAMEALYRSGVSDYKNTIYNLKESNGSGTASLDYQYYYNPTIEDLRECSIEKVLEDSQNFLESNFYTWLKDYEDRK
jgi:hypothetical protein